MIGNTVIFIWLGFLVLIAVLLFLDLGLFHRKDTVLTFKQALGWTGVWIAAALVFNGFVYGLYEQNWLGWTDYKSHHLSGSEAALQFFTGYVVEKSLSMDNLFVIAMVFAYFHVPLALQHRVLFWGIFGAVVLRGIMIALGSVLITRFEWIIYVFGAFLVFSAAKMLFAKEESFSPEHNPLINLTKKFFPVTHEFHGHHFFVNVAGKTMATPLFLALVLVESSDVMFAVDSIPAVFAVTRDPFIVFTSNIFAILGLRSLYFVLGSMMEKFRYLKPSIIVLLAYVGFKMLLSHYYPIPNGVSLGIIAAILTTGVVASLVADKKQ
ncbi:TerC family protein [Bythopirellula goksoeyrii]|uniref:TerC family protein n=1 Tax=Bythopirellula goksoeyrii TaxID=1400387 RepID=UPI001AEFFA4B|nr:TerC family protein [Bythopirellula goksoeyrii]